MSSQLLDPDPVPPGSYPGPMRGWRGRQLDKQREAHWARLERRGIAAEFGLRPGGPGGGPDEGVDERRAAWVRRLLWTHAQLALVGLVGAAVAWSMSMHWQIPLANIAGFGLAMAVAPLLQILALWTSTEPIRQTARASQVWVPLGLVAVGIPIAMDRNSAPLLVGWLVAAGLSGFLIRRADRRICALIHVDEERARSPEKFELLSQGMNLLGPLVLLAPLFIDMRVRNLSEPSRARLERALGLEGASPEQIEAFLGSFREAWNAGDLDRLLALQLPDADDGPTTSRSRLEGLHRLAELSGIPWDPLTEVPLRGRWFSFPEVRRIEVLAPTRGADFHAPLVATPEGLFWR